MLKKFWGEEKVLIGLAGISATLGALFLDVPTPQVAAAKTALANIQVFWLVLLTISLTKLFIDFTKLIIEREKEIQSKYDTPIGIFSLALASVFLVVIANFWVYILSLYGQSISDFITMIYPNIVSLPCFALILLLETRRSKFTRLSAIIVYSFVFAMLLTMVGIVIQQVVLKYFYLYWAYLILPGLFLATVLVLIVMSYIKKKSLLEVLPLEISVHDRL